MSAATARTLSSGGAIVVVNDTRSDLAQTVAQEISVDGHQALANTADVSRADEVEAMAATAVEHFRTVDILVNDAGILRSTTPLKSISLDEWDLVTAVNVNGVFFCTQALLPIMRAQRSGKIVNVLSSAGRSTSTFGGAHYATSKAAVLGLMHIPVQAGQ